MYYLWPDFCMWAVSLGLFFNVNVFCKQVFVSLLFFTFLLLLLMSICCCFLGSRQETRLYRSAAATEGTEPVRRFVHWHIKRRQQKVHSNPCLFWFRLCKQQPELYKTAPLVWFSHLFWAVPNSVNICLVCCTSGDWREACHSKQSVRSDFFASWD